MIPLSQAITRGAKIAPAAVQNGYFLIEESPNMWRGVGSDPLGAAYLGSLKAESVPHFWEFVRESTHEVLCKSMLHKLHMKWPHLGSSVRAWPRMAEELERDRLIPRIVINQPTYRAAIHRSLWAVLTDMHAAGESKEQVAEFLGRHGL
jgi:hypothetical protein